MQSKWRLVFGLSLFVVLLDHASKYWIVQTLFVGEEIPILKHFFEIAHVRNTGSAFGFLANAPAAIRQPFFYVTSAIAFIFLFYYLANTPRAFRGTLTALSLILGGAIGNITDRFMRGSVVDFLHFHWKDAVWTPTLLGKSFYIPLAWPAFNVADMAITSGVVLWLIASVRKK